MNLPRIELRIDSDELVPDWARFAGHERRLAVVERVIDDRPNVGTPPLPHSLALTSRNPWRRNAGRVQRLSDIWYRPPVMQLAA